LAMDVLVVSFTCSEGSAPRGPLGLRYIIAGIWLSKTRRGGSTG
jgi:hypothetical protein